MEPMNGSEALGCVHRLVKGEQNEKDNERVIEHNYRLKETRIKETILTSYACHNSFQPLL